MASNAPTNNRKVLVAAIAILAGAALNCLGSKLSMAIGSPLFFDSIFTAAAGALFGPLAGVLCAVISHFFFFVAYGWDVSWGINFLPCSMATGAIVGAFAKRHFNTLFDIVLCALLVTFANSFMGALIATYAYSGITTHPGDYLVTGLILFGQSILAAAFWSRLLLNLVDKGIAVNASGRLYPPAASFLR